MAILEKIMQNKEHFIFREKCIEKSNIDISITKQPSKSNFCDRAFCKLDSFPRTENGLKMSEFETVKICKCQNFQKPENVRILKNQKTSECENAHDRIFQNRKVSKSKIVRILQKQKTSESEIVRILKN